MTTAAVLLAVVALLLPLRLTKTLLALASFRLSRLFKALGRRFLAAAKRQR